MYSKEKGITYGRPASGERTVGGGVPFGEPAYRQRTRPIRVPANYSGHAVVDGEERPLGNLLSSEAVPPPRSPMPSPEPHFEGLPRVSELGDRRLPPRMLPSEGEKAEVGWEEITDTPPQPPPDEGVAEVPPPPKPSPISVFGHGIGTEELLLIGMIVFLLMEGGEQEDRGDLTETVVLLGLLLLLGW